MAEGSTDQQVTQAIKLGIASCQKGDHDTALKVFKAVYDNPAIQAPADGLSWYGLSIAMTEKQSGKAIQLCKDAINAQFFDERHYENLVRIHLHKGNRTSAESALAEGLKNVPSGTRLAALQKEMGLAAAPVRQASTEGRTRLDLRSLPPVVTLLAGALFFAVVFGITFYFAYQQAYAP